MISPLIALGLGVAQSQAMPPPEVEVAFVWLGGQDEATLRQSERLIAALTAEGQLAARPASVSLEALGRCMGPDAEPTEARRSCMRAVVAADDHAAPVVVVALGDTMERGSWQRMECIGSTAAGFRRTIYIRDFDHPRRDVSESVLSNLGGCIREALE